jgi:hypothetical protein
MMKMPLATSCLFSRMTNVRPPCLQSTLSPMLLWIRQFLIHLLLTPNPSAIGYLFHYFQSSRRFRLTSCKLSRDFVPHDGIMTRASRSCLQGHVFRDVPISSQKTVFDKLKGCMNLNSLHPHVNELYLPYSKCFVKVVYYFSAHSIIRSFLFNPDLNQDQNYIFQL